VTGTAWQTIWQNLLQFGVPWEEKLLRTLGVYLFLLVGLRLAGKRELGQFNPFDLVVLLLLSNTLQNAIIGNDNSLTGGIFGAVILLTLNYGVVRFLFRHPKLERLLEGDPDVLVRDGECIPHRLSRELITREQLEAAARRQGIESLDKVRECRLETGGALTFIQLQPTDEEERHAALLAAIERLAERQAALSSQLLSLQTRETLPASPPR
jgi:uncharacterized membrane protein YcaP (DUF421 family)